MSTIERIKKAEERIKELRLLINYWESNYQISRKTQLKCIDNKEYNPNIKKAA